MATMKALCLGDDGVNLRTDYSAPAPAPGECLVRVSLAGVCSTDLEMMAGYRPDFTGVLGHEFVGVVENAPGADEWIGKRVVGEINIGCGECVLCHRGLEKHCRSRRTLGISAKDGAFAEYLTLPVANLHLVPDTVPDERAVFTEPLAAALQVLEQTQMRPSDRVAVVGDGRLGLLIAQVVARTGCSLTCFGRHEEHLQLVDGFGIETVAVDGGSPDEYQVADTFDIVVEATGAETGFMAARKIMRPDGIIVLKSTFAHLISDFDLSSLVVDEVRVIGSRCGPFEPALRLLAQDQIHVDQMIDGRFKLEDALAALEFAGQRGVLKVLIES